MHNKRARKIDSNQPEIVKALRRHGAKVMVTSHFGDGFPDIVVLTQGEFHLIEIKSSPKAKLTKAEVKVHNLFSEGLIYPVCSVEEALHRTGLLILSTDELLELAYTGAADHSNAS